MKNIDIKIILKDGREMEATLFPEKAPESVSRFLELVKQKFYNEVIFHRVIENFMIQTGGFDENFQEKNFEKAINGEFLANGFEGNDLKHNLGTLSMARTSDPNSATSQFFIVTKASNFLDGNYAAFGKLKNRESEAVAIEISRAPTTSKNFHDDVPIEPIVIKEIIIV
ncbi:peptidyl-prolyl cis-trans isomerase [Spiroplasma sabaudiense Ar-1343]|uniref:Peptidyl-prolyl cis-trans isomerase n=1 Tax=Spiroplasma sabaudiense Ar-1343 TaxID=1276257 RepID=W6A8F8_9MOLU|nr:peptidylprolyl isomerase [Spiroplasma sabaudiense]AHI53448.1 peptidyl-prolyl cis-trans isomerase [Spiroplasma sabaudiense Ar-1343]